jgi:hypothetical protein
MSSNTIRISELPPAVMVEQDDLVPIVQDGITKRATVADIQAASTIGNQSFITVNTESATPQSRKLTTTGPNLLLTDNGPLSTLNISITGFLGSLGSVAGSGIIVNNGGAAATVTLVPPVAGLTITNPDGTAGNPTFALANDLAAVEGLGTTGLIARIGVDTWDTRVLVPPAAGITITNPGGVAGNPTFALANDLAALEGLSGTGYAVRSAADTWVQRIIVGTTNEIGTTNPDGVAGNTIVFLPAALTFTGKTVTGGTFTGGTFSGGTSSPTSLTVLDNAFTIQDNVDPTKQAQFQASGIAPATTRTFTLPDVNDTLVTLTAPQTLTNKTLTTPVITVLDSQLTIQDNVDPTKQMQLQLSPISTGTTRTYNVPNENGDLVLLSTATALGILLG